MSARPFMQLYVGDYTRDTVHLTTEQHGAYLLLLMALWSSGGTLPNDPAVLASAAKVARRRWPAMWNVIGRFFTPDDDGGISQKRLLAELRKASEIGEKRRESGKRGGDAKALKTASVGLAIASVLPAILPAAGQQFGRPLATAGPSRLPWHSQKSERENTTSEQEPAPVEAKEAALPSPADERRKNLDAALRRMGRLKDGRDDEEAA